MPENDRLALEVCVVSAEDAQDAERAGADRIELNCALGVGGLTPSIGTIRAVRAETRLPVMVMIRPREAGFVYSTGEFQSMAADAEAALAEGVKGIVFGILDESGTVDARRCRELIRLAEQRNREAVFHRAFDLLHDPLTALEELIDLGFKRILTSGQQTTALDGADLIRQLIDRARGRIEILPGGGIRPWNVQELIQRTSCRQVHASLREPKPDSASIPAAFGVADQVSRSLVEQMRQVVDAVKI